MTQVDSLIHCCWLLPTATTGTLLKNHCLVIDKGTILALLPSSEATQQYTAKDTHTLAQHIVIPGLINAHTHVAMNLLRGYADDLALEDWLFKKIWPCEQQWVSSEFVADGSRLAIAEMIKNGITCFNDMYFFPEATASVAQEAGIRASLGINIMDLATNYAKNADECITKGIATYQQYQTDPLISFTIAPHSIYGVSEPYLSQAADLAQQYDLPIHTHCQETAVEVQDCVTKSGKRPLQRMHELGLASARLLAVHMTQVNKDDVALLQQCKANVVHCPESNMKLASGICPVQTLLEAGVNVAIGTDGAASNNDLNLLGEMQTAALLAKLENKRADALSAQQVLTMATINGARALNQDKMIGSLEVGKAADIVAINLDSVTSLPVYNPIAQLIYACHQNQVSDVWVAGKQLLAKHKLTTLDEEAIKAKTVVWQNKLL